MNDRFLNSPYAEPALHHDLDKDGQPTDNPPKQGRRRSELITPVPKPKKRKRRLDADQASLGLHANDGVSSEEQEYNPTPIINEIRSKVADWRAAPEAAWGVTPVTARLLKHWRHYEFQGI